MKNNNKFDCPNSTEIPPVGSAAYAAYEAAREYEEARVAHEAIYGPPDPRWKNYLVRSDENDDENPEAAILNEEIRAVGAQLGVDEDNLRDMQQQLSILTAIVPAVAKALELKTAIEKLEDCISQELDYYTSLRAEERELLGQ